MVVANSGGAGERAAAAAWMPPRGGTRLDHKAVLAISSPAPDGIDPSGRKLAGERMRRDETARHEAARCEAARCGAARLHVVCLIALRLVGHGARHRRRSGCSRVVAAYLWWRRRFYRGQLRQRPRHVGHDLFQAGLAARDDRRLAGRQPARRRILDRRAQRGGTQAAQAFGALAPLANSWHRRLAVGWTSLKPPWGVCLPIRAAVGQTGSCSLFVPRGAPARSPWARRGGASSSITTISLSRSGRALRRLHLAGGHLRRVEHHRRRVRQPILRRRERRHVVDGQAQLLVRRLREHPRDGGGRLGRAAADAWPPPTSRRSSRPRSSRLRLSRSKASWPGSVSCDAPAPQGCLLPPWRVLVGGGCRASSSA